MKVIDERGKFFGKINIIDFLMILFLLLLMPMFYFGYKIMTKKPVVEAMEKEFAEIEINSKLIKLKPELLNLISVGDKELDGNGQVIGEIISLSKSGPYEYEFDIGEEQKITKKDPILKQVEAKLKLEVEVKQGKPYYKDKLIKLGSLLKFKTDNYILTAVPIEEKEERIIDLYVILKNLDEDQLKEISVSDKELDENGETIAEILSLGKVESSSHEFDLGSGSFVMGEDTTRKQISSKMRLKCQMKSGNKLYYKNKLIKIGSPLEFKIKNLALTAIPIEEEEEEEERIIDLYMILKNLDEDQLKEISVSDKELDENGETIAEIISLGKIEKSSHEFDLGGGNIVVGEDSSKKQISTRMRLRCQVRGDSQLYFKGEKVEYNTPLELKINNNIFTAIPFEEEEEKIIDLHITLKDLDEETLKKISVGDKEVGRNGNKIAEILSLGKVENCYTAFDIGGENFVVGEDSSKKQISTRMRLRCQVRGGSQLYFKGKKVEHNTPLEFKTDKYKVIGFSSEAFKEEEEKGEERIIDLYVTLKDLDEDTLLKVSVGDKEVDKSGETIAEILTLGKVENSTTEFDIGGGNLVKGEDSSKKQISTNMRLKCQVRDGNQLYFKRKKVEHNTPLEFKTDKYKVIGFSSEAFKEEEEEWEERIIDLSITLKDLNEDMLEKISIGDKEVDDSGKKIAEILSLGKVENSTTEFDIGGGNFITGEDSNRKQISTKMRLRCQVRGGNQLYFKGKKIGHNTSLEFKMGKYEVIGLSSEAYKAYCKEKWMSLRVKFSRVVPEISRVVKEGDIDKDAFEKTIARISSIISNKPALVTNVFKGEFYTLSHPFERDIEVCLDVLCVEKEGAYYYKDVLAKMGNNITFNTDLYSISGLIVGIEKK